MSATALARNLSRVLDELARGGEEIAIERHQRVVGRLVPGMPTQTALEALADLYRSLPAGDARAWLAASRGGAFDQKLRDPWRTS